jgi:putative ABC transport system permease protein
VFNIPIMLAEIPTEWVFVILVTTMLAGVLFSSAYQGVELSGIKLLSDAGKHDTGRFRNWLVMLQITFAIVFLISTLTVYKQIAGMKNADLGIELDNVVICTGPASLQADPYKRQRYENFRNEILALRGFESATFMQFVPGEEPQYGYREMNNPSLGVAPDVLFFVNNADNGFLESYRMKLLAGTDFSDVARSNQDKILINESGIRELGFDSPVEAVGSQVYIRGSSDAPLEIIGVIGDFHNEGLQKPIYPMVWNNNYPPEFGYIVVRITGGTSETMNTLSEVWHRHYPNDDAGFVFADDYFNRQYESESRFGKFYLWLTILSIGIASMGMYGLVLFQLDKRRQEIGIRKVNGAGQADILIMLNTDFVKWVVIAFIVATPIAWYVMSRWLQNFAYQTELSWWIFALAGLMALVIALLTVSWQSWRAARRNPVEALRYE